VVAIGVRSILRCNASEARAVLQRSEQQIGLAYVQLAPELKRAANLALKTSVPRTRRAFWSCRRSFFAFCFLFTCGFRFLCAWHNYLRITDSFGRNSLAKSRTDLARIFHIRSAGSRAAPSKRMSSSVSRKPSEQYDLD
jgi:hypothetical protein